MERDDERQERGVLGGLDVPRLVQEPVALPLRERGAQHVVDRAVPAEIQRADRPRSPAGEDHRREDDRGDDVGSEAVCESRGPHHARRSITLSAW